MLCGRSRACYGDIIDWRCDKGVVLMPVILIQLELLSQQHILFLQSLVFSNRIVRDSHRHGNV